MRRIVLALSVLGIGGAVGLGHGIAPSVRAEETPVTVPLSYVPNLSNWGPTNAIGTASVWRTEAEVRLKVQGLPVLTNQAYAIWLVTPQSGQFLAVGRFNVGVDGAAQLDVTLPGSLSPAISMVLVTVQPDPETPPINPSKRYSIAGSFQGSAATHQQIKQLPNTGGHESDVPAADRARYPAPGPSIGGYLVLLCGMLGMLIPLRRTQHRRR